MAVTDFPIDYAWRRGPRAASRQAFRQAKRLPVQPAGVEVLAAVKLERLRRGREQEWHAGLETSCIAVLAYLWQRAHGEKWAGRDGSALYACSLRQLVMGLAAITGWRDPPVMSRDKSVGAKLRRRRYEQQVAAFVRRHRKTVQRWLDWLQDAGLITHTPQQDEDGFWWRTIIELHACPDLDPQVLEEAVTRRAGWTARERRRAGRGRRRDLTAILRRSRLTRAQRRARSAARRRALKEHAERDRVRWAVAASLEQAALDTSAASLRSETTSRIAPKSNPRNEACESTFTRAPAQITPTHVPTARSTSSTALFDRDKSVVTESVEAAGEGVRRSVGQLDDEVWAIAREGSQRWRAHPVSEWQPIVEQIERRTAELESWPLARQCPSGRLPEVWTAIAWGVEYAAAGMAARLAMWSPTRATHGPRLARALARYERHRQHRPTGWPQSGIGGLVRFLRYQHSEAGRHARCLAYDVAAFNRLTKGMAAYARVSDTEWVDRARDRAARRASAARKAAGEINRRLPERAWLKPAAELVPLPYPSSGEQRKARRLADRDRRLLAHQTPLSAGTPRAAWAYQDRWLAS